MSDMLHDVREAYVQAVVHGAKKKVKSARRVLRETCRDARMSERAIEEMFRGADQDARRIQAGTMTPGIPKKYVPKRPRRREREKARQRYGFAYA